MTSADAPADEPTSDSAAAAPYREVAAVFLRLGCLSFGGPIAHLGYFRAELVEKRQWLDDADYGELVSLAQFLPGPASSQVVFALGLRRAGLLGALLASACFTLPSAILMIALAVSVARAPDLVAAGWVHGLTVAAVAVVAQAVWGMGKALCPDRTRAFLALGAAALLLAIPGTVTTLAALAIGAAIGWLCYRATMAQAAPSPARAPRPLRAIAALALFAALLALLPAAAAATGARDVAVLDSFYRAGALVFGGGHVVLPLLRQELVPPGWLSDERFLAGYSAAQALPGPLFAISAYLGAAMHPGPSSWLWGLACLLAIFLPAWLLVGGALPFWDRLRANASVKAALAGTNAAVVGVLLAALCDPVFPHGIRSPGDLVAALLAFGALVQWKAPPWLVVAACAAAGQWLLPH